MTVTQELLRAHAVARLTRAGSGGGSGTGFMAAVVIGHLDLREWIAATIAFAAGLEPRRARAWRASFTRTIFLAGSPANLCDRFPFDHLSPARTVAWLGPGPDAESEGLRRLLKLWSGPGPVSAWVPPSMDVPGGDRSHRELYLATAGVNVAGCLIHLNHLLVEAVMDGMIGPGDRLTVRPVPRLTGIEMPFAALRVAPEEPGPLRAFAGLTEVVI